MSDKNNAVMLLNSDGTADVFGQTGSSTPSGPQEGSITLTTDTVTFDYSARTATVGISVVGDGTVTVTSDDEDVCTASILGSTITIQAEWVGSVSSTTVTVEMSSTSSYTGATATIDVSNSLLMATWANGSDDVIAAMVAAADAGEIDLYEDAGWRVGDERQVSLGAMTVSGSYDGITWRSLYGHPSQTVKFVLMDHSHGVNNFELVNPVLSTDGSTRTRGSFVVGLKDILYNNQFGNPEVESHIQNESTAGTDKKTGGWGMSDIWSVCNGGFRQMIPLNLRPIFKKYRCPYYSAYYSQMRSTNDWFSLPAAKEFGPGTGTGSNYIFETESNQLQTFEYYEDITHLLKTISSGDSSQQGYFQWWSRSLSTSAYNGVQDYIQCYYSISQDRRYHSMGATGNLRISPFGVI